ncbi:hypothetical protein XBP1_2180009 [Xenorhabdus bovienii str. puntauvense]|uniref:Uncharacterized protein n=1 Tax=Xenorhabdus bovienii str. puntauvense TaxID=1398201 RepID=A0A077NE34_XENBV|nr:hypothetical protein XBP1_2180009 [Xenorhabdus bovienii str. puntauvense]
MAALWRHCINTHYLFDTFFPSDTPQKKNIFHIKKAHQIESQCAFVDYLFSLANQKDITVC